MTQFPRIIFREEEKAVAEIELCSGSAFEAITSDGINLLDYSIPISSSRFSSAANKSLVWQST